MSTPKPVIGWREWVALPDLGVRRMRAKIDTGARTGALHATDISEHGDSGRRRVRFCVDVAREPIQCEAAVVDERIVTDSGGHRDRRLIIMTHVVLGDLRWLIELSLTDRQSMRYPLLLGRISLGQRFLIDPARSSRGGEPEANTS